MDRREATAVRRRDRPRGDAPPAALPETAAGPAAGPAVPPAAGRGKPPPPGASPASAPAAADADEPRPGALALVGAFAAVYVIWGSTYLAIRFAVETLPPFLMAGVRFLVAGGILYAWMRLRGAAPPDARHWRSAGLVGALLLLGGNGAVVWAEQFIPSGLTALLVTTVPLWMVAMDWLAVGNARPAPTVFVGLAVGFLGVAVLVEPWRGGGSLDPAAAGVVLLGSLSWAAGSILARGARLPASQRLATAMEMLAGGALLLLAGLAVGEAGRFDPALVSARSLLALLYLVVFGSLVAFTAYVWLLRATSPARASTYAFVNPAIAVLLGWLLGDEPLTPGILLSGALIVGAVVLIQRFRVRPAGGAAR